MNFFRKLKSFVLGEDLVDDGEPTSPVRDSQAPSTGGFASKLAVPQKGNLQPIIQNAGLGTPGGVQGLNWYTSRLKEDRDGDIADEFLEEPQAEASRSQSAPPTDPALTPLQVQSQHLAAAAQGPVFVHEGNVHMVPPG